MDDLVINIQWESAIHESLEVRVTSAMIKIVLGNQIVTRNEDEWSRTIRDEVRLSAYPLALWLASSWWRLRWEPLPMSTLSRSWWMAHTLTAAGYGYLWPHMLFASDGEEMHILTTPTSLDSKVPVHYLSKGYHSVNDSVFEHSIDEFINKVIARLVASKVEHTELHNLWEEVLGERADSKLSDYRRLEAMLGFDPDECPEKLIRQFESLSSQVGATVVAEIAPVCASDDPGSALEKILTLTKSDGLNGRIDVSFPKIGLIEDAAAPAWQRGRDLARKVRNFLGLNGNPITDGNLCEIVHLTVKQALNTNPPSRFPLGVAIRQEQPAQLKFLLRKPHKKGRRFELARFICDFLVSDQNDRWLPVTDAKTARQKIQRAFAAEFLCPIEALKEHLDRDFSDDAIETAADYFNVGSRTVQTQLVNNHLLEPDVLGESNNYFALSSISKFC